MDFASFKKDIDALLDDFVKGEHLTLAGMKLVWSAKKFSYIYEGKPRNNTAAFMQSLFAHCLSIISSKGSLSQRLGALYCLYCLYETQPFKPSFKIYISLGELKVIKDLVIEAKGEKITVASSLVRRMIDRSMFLIGFVDMVGCSVNPRDAELQQLQSKLCSSACSKLFGGTNIANFLDMNMGMQLNLEEFATKSSEYLQSKESANAESGNIFDTEDDVLKKESTARQELLEIAKAWDDHKEVFFAKTGISLCKEIVPADELTGNYCSADIVPADELTGHCSAHTVTEDEFAEIDDLLADIC